MIKKREKKIYHSRFTLNHWLLVVIACLIGMQFIISNKIATSGKELSQLQAKQNSLAEENQQILSQNVDEMSLHQLAAYAKEQGYIEPDTIVHLTPEHEDLALQD